jgi:hypothetical protein
MGTVGNDGALGMNLSISATGDDTLLAVEDLHILPFSAQTFTGARAGDWVKLWLSRDADNGSDNLDADARVLGIQVTYY